MKDRLRDHLSEVGESFDYLRSDVRNLSRYMAELEELIEGYRTFAATATLSTPADQQVRRKLSKSYPIYQLGHHQTCLAKLTRRQNGLLPAMGCSLGRSRFSASIDFSTGHCSVF